MIKDTHGETMSVAELIEELKKIPEPEKVAVTTEGCDCYGACMRVVYDKKTKEVLLCR